MHLPPITSVLHGVHDPQDEGERESKELLNQNGGDTTRANYAQHPNINRTIKSEIARRTSMEPIRFSLPMEEFRETDDNRSMLPMTR